jgi:hypothetical protein
LKNLLADWDGEVSQRSDLPEYALRIKEPKICDSVKQVNSLLL